MNPIHFGMSMQRVQQAVENHEKVRVRKSDGHTEICELHGPFVEQELPEEIVREVAKGKPGIDPNKEVHAYLIGLKHIESSDPKFRNVISHCTVFEQDGDIPSLDVTG